MGQCLFCKIANKEIPSDIVYEDEQILAFRDISPKAPVHVLVIPKKHLDDLASMKEEDIELVGRMHYVACQIAENEGIDQSGFRFLTNCRGDSGQEVAHLHFHLIGGRFLGPFTQE